MASPQIAATCRAMRPHRRLVYILNKYSATDATHFAHVGHLLEALAARGICIRVLIEHASCEPTFQSPLIEARLLNAGRTPRYVRLVRELLAAAADGYSTTFVRISSRAAFIAILIRRIRGGKVFFWQSGTTLAFDRGQPWSLKKLSWLFTSRFPVVLVQRFCDFIVTGPESMLDYYASEGGIDRHRLRLLYNDIDTKRFARPDAWAHLKERIRAELLLPPSATILLCVHRLSPVRRTLFYFPYLAQRLTQLGVQGFVYVMVGAGPELPQLRQEVEQAGLSHTFRFLGDVPNARIQELYWVADIFVQATYNEGFPRVLLEAMAAGLPIVSTDAGGILDIVGERQRQFVLNRDDRAGLAARLIALLQDPAARAALTTENLKTVQRFATPSVAAMYEQVLFDE